MAQTVTCRPYTTEAQAQAQAQSQNSIPGTGFSPIT